MAIKNYKTVAVCVAEFGVRVTGTGSEMAGKLPASLSLPRQPLSVYPMPAALDAELRADNAAAAWAVMRVGRPASGSASLARTASGTVPSKRFPAMFISEHRERQAMCETW